MMLYVCDNCGKTITGGIIPIGFGQERKDACSRECRDALEREVKWNGISVKA